MFKKDMTPGVFYKVIKESRDKTFLKGDSICLHKDGIITSLKEEGWIAEEDVDEALIGVELKLDKNYAETKIKKMIGNINVMIAEYDLKKEDIRL